MSGIIPEFWVWIQPHQVGWQGWVEFMAGSSACFTGNVEGDKLGAEKSMCSRKYRARVSLGTLTSRGYFEITCAGRKRSRE